MKDRDDLRDRVAHAIVFCEATLREALVLLDERRGTEAERAKA
jgi:hypothetical protein